MTRCTHEGHHQMSSSSESSRRHSPLLDLKNQTSDVCTQMELPFRVINRGRIFDNKAMAGTTGNSALDNTVCTMALYPETLVLKAGVCRHGR